MLLKKKKTQVSNLGKKNDYDTKVSGMELKYFVTTGFNKSTNEIIGNKLKEKQLVKKIQYIWIHR